jgi:hypothetical protein
MFPKPPMTLEKDWLATFCWPPVTLERSSKAILTKPPVTLAFWPTAVLAPPPLTVDSKPLWRRRVGPRNFYSLNQVASLFLARSIHSGHFLLIPETQKLFAFAVL